jgi:hypothetical protein
MNKMLENNYNVKNSKIDTFNINNQLNTKT